MAIVIDTTDVNYDQFDREQQGWVYNLFDCALTAEIFEALEGMGHEYAQSSYDFVRGMQAPSAEMSMRGLQIDISKRGEIIAAFTKEVEKYTERVVRMVAAIGWEDFNPASPKQVDHLLYKVFRLPVQYRWDSASKTRKPTSDRGALEKLIKMGYFYPQPILKHILIIRDYNKKLGTLLTPIDADNRMRTSYNVSGTETGRWSSNANVYKTGTNLQNITDELREIFVADDGYKFAYIDGEQAESRVVGYVSGDREYINACEGGDLHTTVTKMSWKELPWTGDPIEDRKIADQIAYRSYSYRDLAKRLGHGTNYFGKPPTMAKHAQLEVKVVEEFQERYFAAFPGIPAWHQFISTELQTKGYLDTPMGRRRYFMGRLDSDDVLKEGIAFVPQSTIGEWLNLAMFVVWQESLRLSIESNNNPDFFISAQIHDAILVQYRDYGEDKEKQRALLKQITDLMEIPIPTAAGDCRIPVNIEGVGWNWRKYSPKKNKNIDSLMDIRKDEELNRKRTRSAEEGNSMLSFTL